MELIASKQIKDYTVEVHMVEDHAAECEWFAIGLHYASRVLPNSPSKTCGQ